MTPSGMPGVYSWMEWGWRQEVEGCAYSSDDTDECCYDDDVDDEADDDDDDDDEYYDVSGDADD